MWIIVFYNLMNLKNEIILQKIYFPRHKYMHVCLQNGEGGISESVCLQEGEVIGAQEQLCEAGHIDWGPHSLGHVLKTVGWQLPARKCQIVIGKGWKITN